NRTVAYIVPKPTEKSAPANEPAASPESLARGKSILESARAAIGATSLKFKDYTAKSSGELSVGQTLKAEFSEQVLLPDKIRSEIKIPAAGQTVIQALDGDSGWVQQGGRSTDAPAPEVKELKDGMYRSIIQLFLALPDGSEPSAQAQPDQDVEGKPADVALVSGPGDIKMTLFFDKSTHRLAKAEYQTSHPLTRQPAKAEEVFSDYRQQDGLWIPFHTVLSFNGEKFADETMTDFKLNTGLTESIFKKQ
ncbi:MAG: hypothetical protein ACREDR_30925, partial [Blastocatellia bacterium]